MLQVCYQQADSTLKMLAVFDLAVSKVFKGNLIMWKIDPDNKVRKDLILTEIAMYQGKIKALEEKLKLMK